MRRNAFSIEGIKGSARTEFLPVHSDDNFYALGRERFSLPFCVERLFVPRMRVRAKGLDLFLR
jgi:hypothetical protein